METKDGTQLALCNVREGEMNRDGSMLDLMLKNGGFHDGTVGYACMHGTWVFMGRTS